MYIYNCRNLSRNTQWINIFSNEKQWIPNNRRLQLSSKNKEGISFLKHYLISMFKKEEIILMLAKGYESFSSNFVWPFYFFCWHCITKTTKNPNLIWSRTFYNVCHSNRTKLTWIKSCPAYHKVLHWNTSRQLFATLR